MATGARLGAIDLLAPLEVAGASTLGVTVVRAHIVLGAVFTDTDTAPAVMAGMLVRDPTSIGVLDASTALEEDWMYHSVFFPGSAESAVGQPINAPTGVNAAWRIDVKARRRLPEMNDKLYWLLTNTGSATTTVDVYAAVLVALP